MYKIQMLAGNWPSESGTRISKVVHQQLEQFTLWTSVIDCTFRLPDVVHKLNTDYTVR